MAEQVLGMLNSSLTVVFVWRLAERLLEGAAEVIGSTLR